VIGDVGGSEEEEFAAALAKANTGKPMYALVAGRGAKEGVSMGHGGARANGVRSLAVPCHKCHHETVLDASRWPDDVLVPSGLRGWYARSAGPLEPMSGRTGGSGRGRFGARRLR
jgi:hypothetical protein